MDQETVNTAPWASKPVVKTDLQHATSDVKGTVLQEFYRDTNIFITGATGFMGKVLVEKLLRSCPNINRIYLLLRTKKGKSIEERMDVITSVPLFDRLRVECPEFKSKLHAIAGDISLKGLGIGDEDRCLLKEQVHVVFNVAATVRFDETLCNAVAKNLRSTRDLIVLSRSFVKLKSFVHVSTAFSNCTRQDIGECIYPAPIPCDSVISIVETTDPQLLAVMTKKILMGWPNTYVYTKMLAEDAVKCHGQDLPIGIFRPSIVVCTRSDPVVGWVDNLYGPTGIVIGSGNGVLKTMILDLKVDANIVPCDLAISSLIATAWDIAENRSSEIPVYNYVLPEENALKWSSYVNYHQNHSLDCATTRAIWYPMCIYTNNPTLSMIYRLFLHLIPALFMDLILVLSGKKTQMLNLYRQIHRPLDVLAYFAVRKWNFEVNNVENLWKKLDYSDQQIFDFNIVRVNWKKFIDETVYGFRLYVWKEGPETLPVGRAHMKKLYYLHQTTVFFLYCLLFWLVWIALKRFTPKIVF